MYSESDIDGAVAAGVMPAAVATGFRNHVAAIRATPAVDEEHFRLLTGFNDIFVSIAVVLLLLAVAQLGAQLAVPLTGALVAGTGWSLAEYFTKVRRMALPSIVLLVAFVGGVAAAFVAPLAQHADVIGDWIKRVSPGQYGQTAIAGLIAAAVAAITAGAAWLHWRRFTVPITVAAGAVAAVGVVISLVLGLVPRASDAVFALVLVAGLALFAFAMRWDMSDRERQTRRADVAFWLHLAAAPMIAHPTFQLLGVFDGAIGLARALVVLALYVVFALVALAVDRRALLVSSLAYVLYALGSLIRTAGAVELSWALTALVIGSALLCLSAFWQPIRRVVVAQLGTVGGRLPPVQLAV